MTRYQPRITTASVLGVCQHQGLGSRMVLDIVGIILAFAGIWVNVIKPRIRK